MTSQHKRENLMFNLRQKLWLLLLVISIFTAYGCATFKPGPIDETLFRNRGLSKTDGVFKVTATILSREETREIFGLDLYKKSIQPIWLEIENNDDKRVWVPHFGVDPD